MNASQEKAAIRAQVRARLKSMREDERCAASAEVCRRLRQAMLPKATTILFYAPFAEEVDLWPLLEEALRHGKQVALPRFDPQAGKYEARVVTNPATDVVVGTFRIREPREQCPVLNAARVDWILVPGLAFDLQGHRLGRGTGHYDRLLSEIQGSRCGVGFDVQIVAELRCEPHDCRMDALVTPTRWIRLAD